ncbi:hypothetical protein Rsub_12308 [Raphidocelis subcapitata]|uniref:Uncharacterized protein n=1 Tax=Raphidocelis subcapitata TaxID=307507 RepID=A0A2V0PJA5_9CHLO|nr:hypothetical protein Rsub_12308 [Raphidocelis subcapitata]|eukprot:GBF99629.1 hypothetical protein Rsub_12308 [Raphidocelis subcapitata]
MPPRATLGRTGPRARRGARAFGRLFALVAALPVAASLQDPGIVYLDDLTFDKVVNGRDDVLVRFDREYPWGDAHEMYRQLAAALGDADAPLTVAGVAVSNSDDYLLNPRLARRYNLSALGDDELPVFRLFLRHGDPRAPIAYGGELKMDEMSGWLVAHTSIFLGKRGQIEELDATAKRMAAAPKHGRAALLAEARAEARNLTLPVQQREYADYYLKAMGLFVEGGEAYLAKEMARLTRLLSNPLSVPAAKLEVFQWRLNVLSSFVPLATAKPAKPKRRARAKPPAGGGGATAAKPGPAKTKAAGAAAKAQKQQPRQQKGQQRPPQQQQEPQQPPPQ